MIEWVLGRLKEPSTLVGLAMVLFVANYLGYSAEDVGGYVNALVEQWNIALAGAMAILGMLRKG